MRSPRFHDLDIDVVGSVHRDDSARIPNDRTGFVCGYGYAGQMADRLQTLEVISYHRLFEQYQPPSELFDAAGKAAGLRGKSLIPITNKTDPWERLVHGVESAMSSSTSVPTFILNRRNPRPYQARDRATVFSRPQIGIVISV